MSKNIYAGEIDFILEKNNEYTVEAKKSYDGLIKISPRMKLDRENIPSYFIIGLGGGYIEGEKYKYNFTLRKGARSVITTQASTKVYKCENNKEIRQETVIRLDDDSILEYITDSVILFKNAIYNQCNEIYMSDNATLIYNDGITSGWSADGESFTYKSVKMSTKVFMDNKIVMLDNLIISPQEDDIRGLGYFEGYENFGTLLVINKNITDDVVEHLRNLLSEIDIPIKFGISRLEINGFVLRVLGNLTQNIEKAIVLCRNYIRKEFLNSRELLIRKY